MISQVWLRLRRSVNASLPTGQRRDRWRRRRQSAFGFGRPWREGLEDRTLLSGPTATALAATNVTSTGATLNGSVNPDGSSTGSFFQYSTDPNLPADIVTTLAGTSGVGGSADGSGSAARFQFPTGVVVDGAGNLYVADTQDDTIRKITPGGVVTTLAGAPGQPGGGDGTGGAARFDEPTGVAVDGAGNVYVADAGNDTIREITPAGVVTTLAGKAGHAGGGDGTGAAARFFNPLGVAVDGAGDVYVADANNESIRKLSIPSVGARRGLTGTSPLAVTAPLTGLTPKTTYFFQVVATNAGGTTLGTTLSFTTAAAAPAATTRVATAITSTGATLTGSVNPEGTATSVTFVYGTDSSLTTGTTTTTDQAIGSGTTGVAVTAPLTGLTPKTTYFFQVVATNAGGTTDGAILSFTTLAIPPTAATQAATGVTATAAALNATINPEGSMTAVSFVYSTDPTLMAGTITTAAQSIGGGTGAVAVSAALSGLKPGTTYYDRVEATDAAGTTAGAILSFITRAAPAVVGIQTFGSGPRWTTLVITFDEPLSPRGAQDLANYELNVPGRRHPIRIRSAVLGSAGEAVTLRPSGPQPVNMRYTLTVVGAPPDGLTDTEGDPLDGAGAAQAGTNYTTLVTRTNFVSPPRKHQKAIAAIRVSIARRFPPGPVSLWHRARGYQESGDRSRAQGRAEIDPLDLDRLQESTSSSSLSHRAQVHPVWAGAEQPPGRLGRSVS
jgi:hypothetical protein